MENEIIKESLICTKCLYNSNSEQYIESNINLADYYPDIVKILNCDTSVNIYSTEIIGDKLSVDGNAVVRICYLSNENKLCVFDTTLRFSKNIDIHCENENLNVCINAKCEKSNCRAVSPRKAEIRGSILFEVYLYNNEQKEFLSSCSNPNIQLKKETVSCNMLTSDSIATFSLKECFDVSQDVKVNKIYRTYTKCYINDTKIVSDKIMVKGNCEVNVHYLTDGNELKSQINIIEINQIIDAKGIDEDDLCSVSLNIRSCETEFVENPGSPNGRFDISAILEARIQSFRNSEVCTVPDAFSTEGSAEIKTTELNRIFNISKINENKTCNFTSSFADNEFLNIEDCYVKYITSNKNINDGKLIISGNIYTGILYKTSENSYSFAERVFDFSCDKSLGSDFNGADIKVECNIIKCVGIKGNTADFACELNISGVIYKNKTVSVITDLELTENENKDCLSSKINIYFADKHECIWDIAKKFQTSLDEIKQINNIDTDYLEENKTLIFSSL